MKYDRTWCINGFYLQIQQYMRNFVIVSIAVRNYLHMLNINDQLLFFMLIFFLGYFRALKDCLWYYPQLG